MQRAQSATRSPPEALQSVLQPASIRILPCVTPLNQFRRSECGPRNGFHFGARATPDGVRSASRPAQMPNRPTK
eukprot:6100904-Alexandrium_andersonii.AAC.1